MPLSLYLEFQYTLASNKKGNMMKQYFETLSKTLLDSQYNELADDEKSVIQSIAEKTSISENVNQKFEDELSFGARVSDKIASFGGSWPFIFLFFAIIIGWIAFNSVALFSADQIFDPYPYILLNLGLSTLAAFQAPIIMMSQNRQAEKDRVVQQTSYEVSLKLELQVARLHEKVNKLLDESKT